jgi:hypothetical protein
LFDPPPGDATGPQVDRAQCGLINRLQLQQLVVACNLPHDTAHQLVKLYDGAAGHGLWSRSDAA